MKKIFNFTFVLLLVFLLPSILKASTIDNIDMDIYVDENGKATVTETWNASVNQGTEGWHPYYNLGSSSISVISASMDDKDYEIVENWDENDSLSGKAYKAGLYIVDNNEVDVVFGITSYGSHIYKITYEITNFVSNLTDSDIIYWQLFPYDFSAKPENVSIKISSFYEFPDTLDVWGYGKYGAPCYVKDGSIYMTSDGEISSSEYLTLLAKFPVNTFDSESKLENDFNYYKEMADKGSVKYKEKKDKISDIISNIFSIVFYSFFFFMIFKFVKKAAKNNNYTFENNCDKLPKDINNFRDIPCKKDVYRAYWVADTFNISKSKNDFLGVLLLKWIYNDNVIVETINSKKLFKEVKEDVIIFKNIPDSTNQYELKMYEYMKEASLDSKLEKDEFKKWCKKNYSKVLDWFDDVLDYEKNELINEGKVITNTKKSLGIITNTTYTVKEQMQTEAIELKGLKKFLTEFSQIDKKEPIEVKLWNEYLMYAQILGIADKVMEKFKNLYPEIASDMQNYNFDYNTFIFINAFSNESINAASNAQRAAQSYSSGGGGFSSGGGGGGSFGSGGGGGGFR